MSAKKPSLETVLSELRSLRLLVEHRLPKPLAPSDESKIDVIRRHVSQAYGVTTAEIANGTRCQHVVWPRHVAMFMAKEILGLSLQSVGRHFGKDHGTVLHACRAVKNRIDCRDKTAPLVLSLRERLTVLLHQPK